VQALGRLERSPSPRILRPALAIAALLLLGGCKVDLYSKLQEREGNLIVATLLRSGLSADRVEMKDGSITVRVEQDSFANAVSLLKAAGLPHAQFQTMGELFSNEGLVASPTEERARFIFALSQELSRTVSEIDGVISARVHVVLPRNDPLRQDQTPSSASVFIKHDRRAQVPALLAQIKTLIANSVEGLTYDKVSVVFVPADPDPDATSGQPAAFETTASINGAGAEASSMRALTGGLAGIAAAGLIGLVTFFWLWRRARTAGGAAPRQEPARQAADSGREPLRVAS
jgi:type III secretion protein J